MAKKATWTRLTTKPGKALWPHLNAPDVTFNKKGVYHVKLVWTPEEFESLKEVIDAEVDKSYNKTVDGLKPAQIKRVVKQYPYDNELGPEKEETGNIAVKFKSNAYYEKEDGERVDLKPALFDTAGKQIRRKINIGNGSILRINTTMKPYAMKAKVVSVEGKQIEVTNCGVTLYINGVQIKELQEYGASAESMGFDTDGDGFTDSGMDEPAGDVFEEEQPNDGDGDF